ncbi:uncharacterized protein LOC111123713 [Crassostrea virginica]
MEGTEEKSILAIEVTETQREPIRHLFNHNDWNFMEVPVEESADQSESVDSDPEFEDYVIQQSEEAEDGVYFYLVYKIYEYKKGKQLLHKISNRNVFISGFDSGFGNELAKILDRQGVPEIAGCLTEKGSANLKSQTSSRLHVVPLDVTSQTSIRNAVESVKLILPKYVEPFKTSIVDLGEMLFALQKSYDATDSEVRAFYGQQWLDKLKRRSLLYQTSRARICLP